MYDKKKTRTNKQTTICSDTKNKTSWSKDGSFLHNMFAYI